MMRKYKEENIYIKAILLILPTMAIIMGMILFIMNVPDIWNKYDVVNNKSETMDKYSKKHDLLNLIRDFITYRRRYIRFAWIDV